jgi:RNA polymerase sigma factor (sigma-70 family)
MPLSVDLQETVKPQSKRRFGNMSESELVDKLKSGDEAAWQLLYDGFYTYIYQLVKCRNQRISDQDVEDICHEVFEDLVRSIKNFQRKSILKTYIHSLTINRVRQYYRRILTIKRGSGVESVSLDELEMEVPDSERFSPEIVLLEENEVQRLREYIRTLPETARKALTLRYLKNMKYKEIARELCIPEGSVGALIQKSLIQLRHIMMEESPRPAA